MKRSVSKHWLLGIILLTFFAGVLPALHAEKVLYVQDGNQRDTIKMINILKAQGHDVTVWTTSVDGNSLTAAEYAAQGYELLIVDEVISSSGVDNRFRNSPIPVINWEAYLYSGSRSAFNADSGLSGGNYTTAADAVAANSGAGADYGQLGFETKIDIVDPSNPLAAGLPAGTVDVFDPNVNTNGITDGQGIGVISFAGTRTFITSGVHVAATVPGFSGGMCVFGVDAGVANADGTTNLAKWVHLPWNSTEEGRHIIEPSYFLFEAAVAWALDKPQPTKIRDFTPETGAFLPTNTPVSFSVDKTNAAGSQVTMNDISLKINGTEVIGDATITDGGSTWDVAYNAGLPANEAITVVASVTAADGGFSARQGSLDTIDPNNFTFEAEDFNFGGGNFFDDPVLCDEFGGTTPNCYFDRVGYTNIDELELDFNVTEQIGVSNEVYRFGDLADAVRDEWVDTFATADSLIRTQYSEAMLPDWEVRNITTGEWLNYTRTYPTGLFNLYVRVSSPGALEAQVDLVDNATTTNQNLTKLGRFVAPSGTAGYTLVPLTDDAGNAPITLDFSSTTPTTLRVTALSGGWTPNFYMLIPTEAPVNQPPTVAINSPTNGATLSAGVETTISCAPVDSDGTITNLQLFAAPFGGELVQVGELTSAPWDFTFTPDNLGPMSFQTLQVVATDNGGLQASDQIDVRVTDPAVTMVSTATGNGADAEMREENNNGVTSGGNGELNTRTSSNGDRNEIIALRFDLSGYTLSELQNVKLHVVEFRNNGGRQVALYGVPQGTAGATGPYTTEDWNETNLVEFGYMPGLLESDGDMLTQSLDTNTLVTLVGNQSYTGSKADIDVFDDPALQSFVNNYSGSSLITFLIAAAPDYTSTGQGRIAAKEAFDLDGDRPAGAVGDFAPFLTFSVGAPSGPELQYSSDGSNITFTWTAANYKLQSQTNSLGVGLSSNWVDYQGGDTSGVSVSISQTEGTVLFRLAPQ